MEQRGELKTRARELERLDRPEEALEIYLQLAADPGSDGAAPLWARIGELQEGLGRRDSAIDSYTRAVVAFADAGQINNAIALSQALLRIAPGEAEAQLRFGELALAAGYRDYARAGLSAYARYAAATDDPGAAVRPLAEFLRRFPDEDELWREWVEELLALGKEKEAAAGLEAVREIVAGVGLTDTAARLAAGVGIVRPSADPEPPSGAEPPPVAVATPIEEPETSDLPLLGTAPPVDEEERSQASPPDTDSRVAPLEGLEPTHGDLQWPSTEDDADPGALPLLGSEPEVIDSAPSGVPPRSPTSENAEAESAVDPLPLLGSDPFAFDDDGITSSTDPGAAEGAERATGRRPPIDEVAPEVAAAPHDDPPTSVSPGLTPSDIADALLALAPVEVQEGEPATHYDLGLAFKEMGRNDESIAHLAMAIGGGHDPVAVLEVVGELLVGRGEHELATRLLGTISGVGNRATPELLGIHYWLARAAEESGRPADARRALELVLAVDPTFRDAAERVGKTG